jgi:hypothetical protein
MSDWMPWEDETGQERRIARREMFLPPHLQMHGNKRLLRDAILAVRLLGMPKPPPKGVADNWQTMVSWEYTKRNQLIIMQRKAKFLRKQFEPDIVKQCEEAANEMLHRYYMAEAEKAADRYTGGPEKHKARLSEAEFKATVKRRNIRETKQKWEI